jgi:hypothetical protein
VTEEKAKRDDPQVIGVEDLRVAAGFDVFELKPNQAAGGAPQANQETKLQAQPWAVVTGLVPLAKQMEEFNRAFALAMGADPKKDDPVYAAPLLERAEIDPAHPDKLEWKPVPSFKTYEEQWTNSGDEIVSLNYVHPPLTGRLGSLVNEGKWGEAISHPKVPLAVDDVQIDNQPVAAAEPAAAPKEENAKEGRHFDFVKAEGDAKQPPPQTKQPAGEKVIEYYLLRAFDYSVEPGKKYRYRVMIGIKNPNFGKSPQYLKKPESAGIENLSSAHSEATSVVTIPDGHRVLAGAVESGTRFTEPSARMLVTAIDRKEGLEAATELTKVHRGTVANTEVRDVQVKNPRDSQPKKMKLGFQSNILVLDIYGGRDLPARRKVPAVAGPGEILLLDANGNMMVRSELDDQAQYESSFVRDEPPPAKKPETTKKADAEKKGPKATTGNERVKPVKGSGK